jgi:hypothetical protein
MIYVAKPYLFNNKNLKTFDNPLDAVLYLNSELSDTGIDETLDYSFVAPKATKSQLKFAIEEYVGMSKLIIKE